MPYYRRSNPRLVIWLDFLSVVLFVFWTYYSKIQQVVRAEGKVVPSSQNKVVQHLEGGIVAGILVAEGDIVSQGQILFRIKNEFVKVDLAELAISKQALEARSYRLKSLLADRKKMTFPKTINISKRLLEAEKCLFSYSLNDFSKELQVLTNIYQRRQNKVSELLSQLTNLQKEFNLAKKELGFNNKLFAKGAVSERGVLDSQRRLQSTITNYDKVDLSILTAQSEEREALSKLEKSKSNFQLKTRKELNKVLLEVEKIDKKIQARQDVQQRSEVVSSVKGVINKLLVNTIGGIIQPGEALASITP